MALTPMLIICALDAGCVTRDGTTQPKGTAFDRIVTNSDGSDYNPGPGLALIADDGQALYVQNSNGAINASDPTIEPRVSALETMLQSIFAEQQQQS